METIRQLLSRIRWDSEFGQGDVEVGIYDRTANAVSFQPLQSLQIEKGNPFAFTICINGEVLIIPYHRIREVRNNGVCIWKR